MSDPLDRVLNELISEGKVSAELAQEIREKYQANDIERANEEDKTQSRRSILEIGRAHV